VSLSPFRSWPDCTINTSEYDYRKGQLTFDSLQALRIPIVDHQQAEIASKRYCGGLRLLSSRQLLSNSATPFRQLKGFGHLIINADEVFGTHSRDRL
jgi:hypothetical protein